MPHLWLRAELKQGEERVALIPELAGELLNKGIKVSVEESAQRCYTEDEYADVGCEIVPEGSWVESPGDAIILGLKELSTSSNPLHHKHIHFAHAYKNQPDWRDVLNRFESGGGQLFDLEFLVDSNNLRVAAFGYWAGFAGAGVALRAWAHQQSNTNPLPGPLSSFESRGQFVKETEQSLSITKRLPTVLVIGARGRSGGGAVAMARQIGCSVIEWDIEETAKGGPFEDLLNVDIVINCVLLQKSIPPFLTRDMLLEAQDRKLRLVVDVSCDPQSDYNPLPFYSELTSMVNPVSRLFSDPILDLISIDHLPSLLPRESSQDFATQLLPSLLAVDSMKSGVWGRALSVFNAKLLEAKST